MSLVISLPAPLSSAHGGVQLSALAAALMLGTSCVYVYLSQRVPLGLEVLDAVAITVFVLASPDPNAVLGYVFAAVWFRGLYGSTWRSLTRCGLYLTGLAATVPLWHLVPGHAVALQATPLLGSMPHVFITAIAARQLGRVLLDREQTLSREAAVASIGSQLLGVTDQEAIGALAWTAAAEICLATPGLRLLKVVRDGEVLRVDGSSGPFGELPATLPGEVISTNVAAAHATIAHTTALDAACQPGTQLEWVCIHLSEAQGQDAWLVVGAPKKSSGEAMLAVSSLVNQVSLARRTSDVHHALTEQARVDTMTGLANRASFTSELSAHLAHRGGDPAVHVLFLDLDDFKDVNDILGHRAGDALLAEVALRLRQFTRPGDVCARIGGDEFAVALRDTTDAEAARIAQRMVDSIGEPIHLSGRTARVGASIGIASGTPGIDVEELVHRADVAMYAAKDFGKGRTQVFSPALLRADSSRLASERQLAAAAGAGELVVHYQPVLSLPDLRCTALEAFVRWQHPERGLLQPEEFIEAAESSGSILEIGAVVLRRACLDLAGWQHAHPGTPLAVHVNVSARQLDHDGFIDTVSQSLAASGVPAGHLVLELPETAVLNSPAAIERISSLAAHGVRIAIDDFGAVYCSLTTLRHLPVNIVKLDRGFVAGALANATDRTVIEAIARLSTRLGMSTIAEGVELLEQQRFLEGIGIDALQGPLHLRPVPAAQLGTWLHDNLTEVAEVRV